MYVRYRTKPSVGTAKPLVIQVGATGPREGSGSGAPAIERPREQHPLLLATGER